MRKRILVAATMVAALSPLVAVTAAQAADRDGSCDSGESCLYKNDGRSGGIYEVWSLDNDFHNNYWYNTDGRVEDEASSVWNRRTCAVLFYKNDSLGGASYRVNGGASQNINGGFEDEISSYKGCA